MKKWLVVSLFLLSFCFLCDAIPAAEKSPAPTLEQRKIQVRTVAQADIHLLGAMIAKGEPKEAILGKWKAVVKNTNNSNLDVNALVQQVLKESYLEQANDLKTHSEKVKYFNDCKNQIRDEVNKTQNAQVPGAVPVRKKQFAVGKGIPPRLVIQDSGVLKTEKERQDYIRYLNGKLNEVGDDANLANTDLQNAMQKQQQLLNQVSNVSKMLNDTAMDVIRKMGG
jgi:hypothetical protein